PQSTTQTKACFINLSQRPVSLIWIDHFGQNRKYGTLKYRQFFKISTYVGHLWRFQDEQFGLPMHAFSSNKKYVIFTHTLTFFTKIIILLRILNKNLFLISNSKLMYRTPPETFCAKPLKDYIQSQTPSVFINLPVFSLKQLCFQNMKHSTLNAEQVTQLE